MKRITVQVTVGEDWSSVTATRKIKTAMINAAVQKATENDASIMAIDTRVGNVRKPR